MSNPKHEVLGHDPLGGSDKIQTAVVSGLREFNVPGLCRMFASMDQVEFYHQHMGDYMADWEDVRSRYDVVVFFHFHRHFHRGRAAWQSELEKLGETDQGIVVLHHALQAYPQWPFWSELVGIPHEVRMYDPDALTSDHAHVQSSQKLMLDIVKTEHPITKGLSSWPIVDEVWSEPWGGEPGPAARRLITTGHHAMARKTMAWAQQFRAARIFCLQPGRSNDCWFDRQYRTLLTRGIQWAAGRL